MANGLLDSLCFVSLVLFHMAVVSCGGAWGTAVSTAVRQHIEFRSVVQQEGHAQAWYLYVLQVV